GGAPSARTGQQVIECEIVARAAILAGEFVAQEYVKPREGGLRRGLYESLERHHARQLHFRAWAANRALVFRDDVYALKEYRLDRILPAPERERVIAERPEIGIENQCRKAARRHVHVQGCALLSSRCSSPSIGQQRWIVKPAPGVMRCSGSLVLNARSPGDGRGIRRHAEALRDRSHAPRPGRDATRPECPARRGRLLPGRAL